VGSLSAGTDRIAAALSAGPPRTGVEVEAEFSIGAQLGRLTAAIEREERRRQALNQCITVVDIGPVDYIVVGGQPRYKAYRASGADMSPQEGLMWDVTRLTIYGLNSNDEVDLFRPAGTPLATASTALFTFVGIAGIQGGGGIATWTPGSHGLWMRPDDIFVLTSSGTAIGATELVLSGQAIQVDLRVLADYLM
jgi:hypothetical protein